MATLMMTAALPWDLRDVIREIQRVEPFYGAGLVAAFLFILLLWLLLPRHERKLARSPFLYLCLHVLFVVLEELAPAESPVEAVFGHFALFFLVCALGRSLFLLGVETVPARRFFPPPPKIVLDLFNGVIYAVALLITLNAAGFSATSLVTGSAAVTVILGLSLRDTLGNLFAGLAIQAERPFEVGDWIQFDERPEHIGKVLEINWRATKVITLDEAELIVPNSVLAMTPIRNFSKPEGHSRRSIYVVAPYDAPPQRVQQVILDAVGDSFGVLPQPPPSVVTNSFTDRGVEYWVRFFTLEFGQRDRVDGGVRDRIYYALRRHGITIPVAQRNVVLREIDEQTAGQEADTAAAERLAMLRGVDFLRWLSDEAIARLAAAAQRRLYAAGEVVLRQGDGGDDLFIVFRGEVRVSFTRPDGTEVELARLGPTQFFGEMSLLTGARRSATVRATRECELLVVTKAAMAPHIAGSLDLAEHICDTLTARQAERLEHAVAPAGDGEPRTDDGRGDLLRRIKEFFSL